jgi:hypothetical protein
VDKGWKTMIMVKVIVIVTTLFTENNVLYMEQIWLVVVDVVVKNSFIVYTYVSFSIKEFLGNKLSKIFY